MLTQQFFPQCYSAYSKFRLNPFKYYGTFLHVRYDKNCVSYVMTYFNTDKPVLNAIKLFLSEILTSRIPSEPKYGIILPKTLKIKTMNI